MRHLVFLLEEPSARDALEIWLPRWVPGCASGEIHAHFLVFEGKQDLERRMTRRLQHWLLPESRFIVMRDQDSGDCLTVKADLRTRCEQAGRPDAIVRIACRELESFFVGDWAAVAQAVGKPALARLGQSATYRQPDRLESPSAELRRHLPGYQKREGARRIAPHIDPARNRSRSFQVLHDTLCRLSDPSGGCRAG